MKIFAAAFALLPLVLAGEEPFEEQVPLKPFDARAVETISHNSAAVSSLVAAIEVDEIEKQALALANDFNTRQSQSTGLYQAVDYVAKLLSDYGFETETPDFRAGYAPNVIGTVRGTRFPDEFVILGTHLDDRNTNSASTTTRAPGANDDGSGSAALLATAKAIADSGVSFERTVSIEFYTGEEQGLVGSRAQAAVRRQRGDNVIAQLQQDMTGFHRAGDPAGIAFVQDSRAVDIALTNYTMAIAREYAAPGFEIYTNVLSGSSCCSDHQSYVENGYPSVGLIEPRGYTGDPQYHREGDVVERADYDVVQIAETARVTLAAAADLAGCN